MGDFKASGIDEAARIILDAEALLIGAGAGMGVDSGMPDFRGPQGFWRAYPPYAKLGLHYEQMASPDHFESDPPLGWGFYGHRTNLYRQVAPHPGFAILKRWGDGMTRGSFVYTSNVDNHFQKSGFSPDQVVECHGSIEHRQCLAGCGVGIFDADPAEVAVDSSTFRAVEPLPACPACGGPARPNILMFGDSGWDAGRTRVQGDRLEGWLLGLETARVAVVELGAGRAIPTVRRFCDQMATLLGGTLIRINVRESDVPEGHLGLPMGALDALRAIDGRLADLRAEGLDQG